jgi:hypothetical protein
MLWNATGTWRQIRHRHKLRSVPEAPAVTRPIRQRRPIAALVSTLLDLRLFPAHHNRVKNRA